MKELYSIHDVDDVTLIQLLAELDNVSIGSLKAQLRRLVTGMGKRNLVLDCSHIKLVNSTIVGALVDTHDFVHRHSGTLSLCCVDPRIYRVLELVGASEVLVIHDTQEQALVM